MNDYQDRVERRRERIQARADRLRSESEER